VGDASAGAALDLGAGEGRNAIWLAQRGWRVTAVDFSDVALARARERAEKAGVAERITWVEADLVDYRAPTNAFDLVLVLFVHLPGPDRGRLLARAADALAPAGTVLVVGYDTANATEGEGGVRDPERLFSPSDVVRELPELRIERAGQLRVGKAVDAIVRAVREG
jgi:SAM-dependent methyltransferase